MHRTNGTIRRRLPMAVPAFVVLLALVTAGSVLAATTANAKKKPPKLPTKAQIHKMLPASIKTKGEMVVATSAAFPPDVYVRSDGSTIVGFVPDVVKALAKAAGIKATFVKTTFATILTGIQSGRYDAGVIFLDTKLREQQASFVNFLKASDSWVVRKSYSGDPVAPCGLTVGVGAGSAEALLLPQVSKEQCDQRGKPGVKISTFPTFQNIIALQSGRVDAAFIASDVGGYAARQSDGAIKIIGKPIVNGVEGLAIPRTNSPAALKFAQALRYACQTIVNNGTYIGILKTWGVGPENVKSCTINGAKQ